MLVNVDQSVSIVTEWGSLGKWLVKGTPVYVSVLLSGRSAD